MMDGLAPTTCQGSNYTTVSCQISYCHRFLGLFHLSDTRSWLVEGLLTSKKDHHANMTLAVTEAVRMSNLEKSHH